MSSLNQASHPLAPITAAEIKSAALLAKGRWPANVSIGFKAITLQEPEKHLVVGYLEAERQSKRLPSIDRKVFVVYTIKSSGAPHEAIVNITTGKVEHNVRLGPFEHPNADPYELMMVEKLALEDPRVKAELAKLELPTGAKVMTDPWGYGSDGLGDEKRMFQCFLYVRPTSDPDGNHYAHPLDISPVVDATAMKVIRVDKMPTGADNTIKETSPFKMQPVNDYLPENQNLRTDLKPLHVVQPEGASFQVSKVGQLGERITWQKWSFILGFNQREGMVLYDVHYDNRSVFYRLSLSDMSIPYADPRHPYHKKHAFDLGDAGAGITANNLELGCDCLGHIHYLSAVLSNADGEAQDMPNVVCIHEQDSGIGWKHTNYRTGRAAVVRNRELVLQSIITVSNYEYILAFIFNQAGEVMYEVRATGILSTQPIDEGLSVPFGTVVHPGVLAAYHQHFFSLRIDPAIDGHKNRLSYTEAHPYSRSEWNPHGTGYYSTDTVVEKSAGLDLDASTNRFFKIENSQVRNKVNNKPVAYKIHAPDYQKIISDQESFHFRRSEFSAHNIYVTKYKEGELWAGGKHTMQSRGGQGLRSFTERQDNVVDEDIVVWVSFGMNHIPRIEDFPVMPVEIIKVSMKPANFFEKNPSLDVPPSKQAFNKSRLVERPGLVEEASCCLPKQSKI